MLINMTLEEFFKHEESKFYNLFQIEKGIRCWVGLDGIDERSYGSFQFVTPSMLEGREFEVTFYTQGGELKSEIRFLDVLFDPRVRGIRQVWDEEYRKRGVQYGIGVRFEGEPSTNWDYFATDGGITNNLVDAWWSYDVMHTRKQMEILKKSWKKPKFWLLIDR